MREKIITLYKFSELSPEAQAKAIEENRDINVDFDQWADYLLDEQKENLTERGYTDPTIYYTGFWSQGDGASFKSGLDVLQWLKSHKRVNAYRPLVGILQHGFSILGRINQSGHYYHEFTVSIDDVETDYHNYDHPAKEDKIYNLLDTLKVEILEDARKQAKGIYKELEQAYEDMTTDEAVKDTIEANDYEFTAEGKIDY